MATKASSNPTAGIQIDLGEFIREGIEIQHRFVPEPRYAKTGVGFMRSAGVREMQEAKQHATPALRRRVGR